MSWTVIDQYNSSTKHILNINYIYSTYKIYTIYMFEYTKILQGIIFILYTKNFYQQYYKDSFKTHLFSCD